MRALATDDDQPRRAGMATHRAVSISGAARCSVFCQREPVAERTLEQQAPHLQWAHTRKPHEHAEQQQRRRDGANGQGER
jgi:hypothetical protein